MDNIDQVLVKEYSTLKLIKNNGEYQIIDNINKEHIPFKIIDIRDGIVLLSVGEGEKCRYGYCSETGKWIMTPRYIDARPFSEGRAAVYIGYGRKPLWGYIDENGDPVIGAIFTNASDFVGGYAHVTINGIDTSIDKFGTYDDPFLNLLESAKNRNFLYHPTPRKLSDECEM